MIAIMVEVASVSNQYHSKRDKENELIFRGQAYVQAIKSYYEAKPKHKIYPTNLDDLISDSRFVYKRHIRKLYKDPVTNDDWQEIKGIDGGIIGVMSTSTEQPLKQNNFPKGLEHFENSTKYSSWHFEYIPVITGSKSKINKTIKIN